MVSNSLFKNNTDHTLPPNKHLVFVVISDWFFLSHRLPIALAAQAMGYKVTVVAIDTGKKEEIEQHGLLFINLPGTRSGTNLWRELKLLFFFIKLYKKIQPSIVHHVTLKPVTYGSIAARIAKVPKVVNAISGLGFLFINEDKNIISSRIVKWLFGIGFSFQNSVFILQNKDDFDFFADSNLVNKQQVHLIKGSGVDLTSFGYRAKVTNKCINIVLPARMLWDKGVGEFVAAASILKKIYSDRVSFILAGKYDPENKAFISKDQLQKWVEEGAIQWIGHQEDMVSLLKDTDIVVLPSYREGLPKSLIEACAIGRPIVTTDVPGCREVVQHGVNGYLVPEKNSIELAKAIEVLINDENLRILMGKKGREIAVKEFDIQSVIEKTLAIYTSYPSPI